MTFFLNLPCRWGLLGLAALMCCSVGPARAQAPLVVARLTGPITLDGMPDEPAWEAVAPLPLTMYQPLFEGEMTARTEIRLAYDDAYLYLSGRLYDEPGGPRANSLYRDRYSGDDVFALILDTFDDNENALWFFTTPAGTRFDMAVSNDAEFSGGSPFGGVINNSWNTFWDAATVVNDEGWFAEMRIPYSSLGFQDVDGHVEMGLITYRYISRKNERHIFPAIPPNWGLGFAKPSQAHRIVLDGVHSQKPLYLTPYALGGFNQTTALNDAETAYLRDDAFTQDVGLDLKYALTSNLTLDATLNTDFAQAEADDQQVNLTRFSLFFPEKRQFFQERAGLFDFSTGRVDRLFHSRRIGLEEGETIPILGGARLVGRVGAWDVGLIEMQTAATRFTLDGDRVRLPSENFGVVRLRRQVFNENSYAGALVTTRLGDDGAYNVAYGLDGIVRLSERDYVTVKWAQSLEEEVLDTGFGFFDTGTARINWERRGQQGFSYSLALNRAGPDFNPGIGFVTRTDYTQPFARIGYGWFPGEGSVFRQIGLRSFGSFYFRNTDGSLESATFGQDVSLDLKTGDAVSFGFEGQVEDLLDPLELPEDTVVPVGRYTFAIVEGFFNMHDGRLFRAEMGGSAGVFYDGRIAEVGVVPTWNVSRYLELGGSYRFTRARFADRDQGFDVHLVALRVQMALNTKVSLNAFVQLNSAADLAVTNVRFRYNFREGNDLWIVYNEGLNLDRSAGLPMLPRTDTRTFLLKYTYTFGL